MRYSLMDKKHMEVLLNEWIGRRNKDYKDINYGSGDFTYDHMLAFGMWLNMRLKKRKEG